MNLDTDIINELVDLFAPYTQTDAERRELLRTALGNAPVLHDIAYSGVSRRVFITNTVTHLLDFGEIKQGRPALMGMLETLRARVGVDKHPRIDAIIQMITTPEEVADEQREEEAVERVGRTFGPYKLVERLESTSTTDVYLVHHQKRPGEALALKVLRQMKHRKLDAARFQHEVASLKKLKHPHIARFIASGEWDGLMYLVMRYYPGGTLKQLVQKRGPLPLDAASRVLEQVAGALEAAHQKGIVHRDVKPSNVLFDQQQRAILTDFGVAMVSDATIQSTGFLGTAMYAAPEQFDGGDVGIHTDVYALGLLLHYMLTGQPPFPARDLALMALRIKGAQPKHPSEVNADLSRLAGDVVMRAVQEDNAARHKSPGALAQAFREALEQIRLAPVYALIRRLPAREARRALVDIIKRTDDPAARELAAEALAATRPLALLPNPPAIPPAADDEGRGMGLDANGIPDIVWCEVSPGKVKIEGQTFEIKEPFYIAKYPVTYQQFQAFIDAEDGYRSDRWWEGLAGKQPGPYEQEWKHDNHPRENVTWYGAVAFCRWLSAKMGFEVTLPTEWQWQQAATGGEPDRAFPWGPEWEEGRANTKEAGIKQTTPVDRYPEGASPVGALDMAGNVWEWCLNEYHEPSITDMGSKERRTVRGGSWYYGKREASAAARGYRYPSDRLNHYGFRCVCGRPHLSTEH